MSCRNYTPGEKSRRMVALEVSEDDWPEQTFPGGGGGHRTGIGRFCLGDWTDDSIRSAIDPMRRKSWKSFDFRSVARYGEPSTTPCAMKIFFMTHGQRSRQLPTTGHHASLPFGAIREYQFDQPSEIAALLESGLCRAGS